MSGEHEDSAAPGALNRRTTLKWVLAAAASVPLLEHGGVAARAATPATAGATNVPAAKGYGTDPDLVKTYRPGELWPLTFTPAQRRIATTLCDLIIPADIESPSASAVGVVDFLDEWISAPYPRQQQDRAMINEGFAWLDAQAKQRFASDFVALREAQQSALCDDICYLPKARPEFQSAAKFFARYRDLTAGGFYTTPAGRKDLKYIGNVALASFDGPPLEVLERLGLA